MGIRARYLGDGTEYHNGIPARDLTDEEFAALDDEQRRTVEVSKLYRIEPEHTPAEGGK